MRLAVCFLPVFLFLVYLVYIDSFKLVKIKDILACIGSGMLCALAAYFINSRVIAYFDFEMLIYTRYCSPVIEELLKIIFILYLIRKNKIGFMVDGAILGFAIGTGFSTVENLYYFNTLDTSNLFVWVVRGLGTAVMHGGTTSVATIIIMGSSGSSEKKNYSFYIVGIAAAVVIHSIFNHFFVSPLLSSLVILVTLPLIMSFIFQANESSLRKWLEVEFDTEAKIIAMINKGMFSETKAGKYLVTIRSKFSQEVFVDVLCFIKIYLELSIRAKSILLMKEAGFEIEKDIHLDEKLKEFKYLEKSIGKTGLLAISPVFRFKNKDLWKINMLK